MVTEVQKKYPRTNIFVMDAELWAWAQYKAKLLGYNSVSEYIFELLKTVKESEEKIQGDEMMELGSG